MPIDRDALDEDDLDGGGKEDERPRFTEFDCPACNANNPRDDPFGPGERFQCFYCGQEVETAVSGTGRLIIREA